VEIQELLEKPRAAVALEFVSKLAFLYIQENEIGRHGGTAMSPGLSR